jgi:SAM-dependent methyltransferase
MSTHLRSGARYIVIRAYSGARRVGRRALGVPARPDGESPPWLPLPETDGVMCNICRWRGDAFRGGAHVEFSLCPGCGSNGRDRFVHWCFASRVELHPALRVIECSPRLSARYREAMSTWFFYRTSDYDLRAHSGNLQLDLQAIDLPDACIDVMLCAHVLEHVADTDRALAELRRVIAPRGHLLLQVPVLQGRTDRPAAPEFHGDDTPVFWRFGFDLTGRLRDAGFTTELLCTASFADAVKSGSNPWTEWSSEFDVVDLLVSAIPDDLVVIADRETSARLGVDPGYMYLTWDCAVA